MYTQAMPEDITTAQAVTAAHCPACERGEPCATVRALGKPRRTRATSPLASTVSRWLANDVESHAKQAIARARQYATPAATGSPSHALTSAERERLGRSAEVAAQLRMSRVGERETYIAEPEASAPRVSAAAKHAAKRKEMSSARDAMDREFAAIYAAKQARKAMTANKSGYRMER